jgi:endoglucanase
LEFIMQSLSVSRVCAQSFIVHSGRLVVASLALAATAALAVATESRATADTAFGFQLGVNEAGLEFAEGNFPGTLGTNYVAPTAAEIGYYAGKNMTIVRLPFAWERLQPTLSGAFDPTYLGYIQTAVSTMRSNGLMVLLDPHNYSMYRLSGQNRSHIGTSSVPAAAFVDLWSRLADLYKGDAGVVFGLMNEPKQWDDYGEELQCAEWAGYANQAIAAIRAKTTQNWIFVPGNFWTGAWSWTTAADTTGATNATAMASVVDSAGKMAFEVHQYLDTDYSGTSDTCYASHGAADLASFTAWLRAQPGRIGFIGEVGAGSNTTCYTDLNGVFDYVTANRDVWAGWTYWASSNWYIQFSIEPTNWANQSNATQLSLTPVDTAMMTTVLKAQYASGSTGALAGDLNHNGRIEGADLAIMLNGWGAQPLGHRADFNADRMVDGVDLEFLLTRWGASN